MKNGSRAKLIGLITDQSPDLLVGLFGILKSGNGFVPITPATPSERIRFIIEDCQIEILVTESKYLDQMVALSKHLPCLRHIICLDAVEDKLSVSDAVKVYDCEDLVSREPEEARAASTPDELVYVIFTSGSTGVPKGVPITHRNLTPLLFWSENYFKLGEHTRVLQNLSYGFDFGVFELLTTALFGGTLYFVDKQHAGDLPRYADYTAKHAINTIHTTPSFFREIIPAASQLASLEKIHLGGEELTADLVQEISQVVAGDCVIYNGYGPTEASINCSIFKLSKDALANYQALSALPIGKPSANNSLFVLDSYGQPVPIGVPGELHVGGTGLTSGYLNRPELTAEKFAPNLFSKRDGERLYKTGDRVRYLPDGNLIFIGRIDYQVKVRGFRIELGEIEAALRQHPGIGETVVLAREDTAGSKFLVAYLTVAGEQPSVSHLRAFLKERLPEYMVPSAFVMLDGLPVNPGGKVDRQALPVPELCRQGLEETFVAPRTPEEEMIASICAEFLGLRSVGVHDDLFNLGCHSLIATRIIARLRQTFQIELPLVSLFENPSVARLAAEVARVVRSEQHTEILPIRPVPRDRDFPLSFAQERLWFLCKLDPNNMSYYIPRALRITGPFDVAVLERTFTEIVRRHEILRTTFPLVNGKPIQLIHPPQPFAATSIDLRDMPEDEKAARIEEIILEQGQRPFDLEQDLMLRVTVLRLAELEYILILTEHHLVHDGWTQGVLVRDFLELYAAFAAGKSSPLPEPTLQYADFAYWQRQWLTGEVLETQLAYWVRQLAGAPSFLDLPGDRPRPPVQSFKGAEQTLIIDRELAESLRSVSRQQGTTLFMTMFAAFNTLLYRYTSQEDILVGSGIANRRWSEIESLLGMIINTLVLRTDLAGNPTGHELLQRVRAVCLQAYTHQDLPFEKIVEELKPERSLSYNPIFQVMFSFMDAPTRELELPGLTLNVINAHNRSAKFDLNVVIIPHTEQLIGQTAGAEPSEITVLWEYSTDIFESPTIARMLGHFENLLRATVTDLTQPISDLPILTEAERRQLLIEWNDTNAAYPQDRCIHHLFEMQVQRVPNSVAVASEDSQLTYLELNHRANQLAHYLRRLGVGPESLVGICLDRSADMILAILAVLKAGSAYVPLDPGYPKDRLVFMLEDSQMLFLLTRQDLIEGVERPPAHVIRLDADWDTVSHESTENVNANVMPDNAAYVIYTSGSTGRPKGVLITHNNVTRLFDATGSWFHFDEEDIWTLFHSYAFDFSVWEIWGALLYGGRLVVVPYWVSRRPEAFYEWLGMHQVTVLNQTPSAFYQLSHAAQSTTADSSLTLRLVIFGGEALELQNLAPWIHRYGDTRPQMVNMYGITETTVHVTYRPLTSEDISKCSGSVIGCPIPDLQVYILGRNQQPAPLGVAGGMYVGGAGLARGYIGRPELTAERFVPDPFSNTPGARLYVSGDLARYRAYGELEYLGRIDHQVKIRGFRIEPGEIEAALLRYGAVREAVVLAREDAPGDKRLVSYLITNQGADISISDLRDYLKEMLPEHMIPSAFVVLAALPLTANGKLDRRALPAPDSAKHLASKAFQPPRTPEEKALVEIWAEVLGVEQVGVDDNFFDLGGDSILSIRVLSLAQDRGLTFSLQQLFQQQTVRELARAVSSPQAPLQSGRQRKPFSLISQADRAKLPSDVTDAYPLSRLQSGMLFHSQYNPSSAVYHNILSLHVEAPFDLPRLREAIKRLVARHDVLRTSFDLTAFSTPLQLVHQSVTVQLEVDDLRSLSEAEQETALQDWMAAERQRKFNVAEPPLVRFNIHRRTEQSFQFTQSEHHVILDGWSVALMLADLFKLYLSKPLAGDDIGRDVVFRDFVALECEAIECDEYRSAWAEKLKGSTITRLPRRTQTDREESAHRLKQEEVWLPADVNRGLRQLCRLAEAPLKSVLLAAHLGVLSFVTGQTDIITGLVTNGRPEEGGGDQILGLFLNTLPLRMVLMGGTWVELVRLAFEAEREVMPRRRYPLPDIQKAMGGQALFETAFNFVHFHVLDKLEGINNFRVLDAMTYAETNFTLMVHFSVDIFSAEIKLRLDYDAAVLSEEQMRNISGYYRKILSAMAAEPAGRYEYYSPLSEREKQQVRLWNDTQADYPRSQCIHELFEAQARRTPDAIAIVNEDENLSYRELNRNANRVAFFLQSRDARPEARVGISIDRSLEMVIGLLGILKSGASYVPLDPEYPSERLQFMLQDAGVSILLTEHSLADRLACDRAEIIRIEDLLSAPGITGPSLNTSATSGVVSDDLAYTIYTSGSTGRPKGVAIEHRSAVAFLDWAVHHYSRRELSAVLASTSVCFDLSVFELFAPLSVGGKVVLAQNALQSAELLASRAVTLINTVPSAMAELVRIEAVPESVISVNLAGEALKNQLAQEVYRQASVKRVRNLYGPTEDTTYSTVKAVERGASEEPTIGVPINNGRAYILDAWQRDVPVETVGELYLGGEGLARGYVSRAEETAAKFIPDEHAEQAGARLYRTGDLARYGAGGEIEYLGRIDHQVKIRGFRIEPGEIEAALLRYGAVREAVVLAREDARGEMQLVAYVVTANQQSPTTSELRNFLKKTLPEYMLPSAFVFLDSLPLTPNGKLDRQRLPSTGGARPELQEDFVAPVSAVEEIVAGIWAETLVIDRVGIHDNFFDLGGDSLLAVRVGSRVREAFQVDVPLKSLFDAPTVGGFCESILKAAPTHQAITLPPIMPMPKEGCLPLSLAQQRLWFVEQLAPGSPLHNLNVAMRVQGPLDVDALGRSFSEVIRRHETLRMKIVVSEGQPSQVIGEAEPFKLRVTDLSELSSEAGEAEARRMLRERAQQPFDFCQGALLRVDLLRLSAQHHLIAIVIHHIVSDRWSLGILFREVSTLYEAYSAGHPSTLPELSVQYVDYAVWQRNWLQEEMIEKHLPYWREHLSGALQLLDLPTARPRPLMPNYQGGRVPVAIDRHQAVELKSLARRNHVTLFMALLAAFKTLLHRYTGQGEILVGTPVANRNRVEIENLIGLFVNTLVLKTDLSGDPDFEEVLRREKEIALGAFAHQEVPFEKLVEALRLAHGLVNAPLLQVMFVLQNAPMPALTLPDLTISLVPSEGATAEFDITLSLTEADTGLVGLIDYSTDLFDEPTIRRMAGHFQVLLEAVAARATGPISSLPLLSQAERTEILSDWNNTTAGYPQGVCLHQLFEAQVERAPDAIAIVCEQQWLTYAALNDGADRLADRLRELGIGPDVRVGVGVEPSLEMVVGLLGVLKAGGAYVPLDPEYPTERLAFMIADAEVKALLTQRRLAETFTGLAVPVVYLDGESNTSQSTGGKHSAANVRADNLAYVIYTSGSTGQAKGVMVPHSAAVNTLLWRINTYSLTGADRILQNIPFTFDPSVWQIFGALLSGASLLLPHPGGHKEVGYLTRLMAEREVTITDFPPSVLRVLLDEQDLSECSALRYVFSGGEALPVDVQDRFLHTLRAELGNQYGPTETTIDATYWRCQSKDGGRRVPIGRPIANAQIYLLDSRLEAVPVGIAGELYIGGAGLSRGYLNMPDATAEQFIPNPFADQSGARLYKSGDLAHYLEGGVIEFLDRVDSQVKIRGARVEMGEVEAALRQYSYITDTIVVAREDGQGDKKLVAYVAADWHSPLTDFELRSYLRGRLPEFMLPSSFVILDKLPYTSTGKIDRLALPAPPVTRADQQAAYVSPRTPIEETLTEIWQRLLQAAQIGVQDNFFSAGGHSLMSMQLLSQVRKTFGVDLSLRSFFASPTVEALARNVEEAILAKSSADSVDALLDMLEGIQESDSQS